jgi:hypothetical protein
MREEQSNNQLEWKGDNQGNNGEEAKGCQAEYEEEEEGQEVGGEDDDDDFSKPVAAVCAVTRRGWRSLGL